MKHKAQQFEIPWTAEAFALVVETAVDGQRVAAEAQRRQRETAEAQARQADMFQVEQVTR